MNSKSEKTFLGHPIGLFVLFFTEMWERFSYYGMRGLLKLYMVNYLFVASRQIVQGGAERAAGDPSSVVGWEFIRNLISSDPGTSIGAYASVIYGWYTGLVYLTPLLGGYIADKYWGQRKSVFFGGILMAIGQFILISDNFFFLGLFLLIIGNGAFKPNISTQVGNLYPQGDPRRDGAFTIFYMGINLGAFLCNLVCGTLAATVGWGYGFGAAGVGMISGLIIYAWGQKYLAFDNITVTKNEIKSGEKPAKQPLDADEKKRVLALIALCMLNIVFWAVYEQQGNTMQTWADEKTIWPVILGFQVPATWFQSFNPFFIFALAPLFDMLWRWQAKRNKEPTSVGKMAMGCILLGLSFIVMVAGVNSIGDGKGSWFWPVFCVLILTVGELYLSPIGLSLVTKVSPIRIVSTMMGMWFLSSFLGNILSGYVGILYEEKILSTSGFFWFLTVLGVVTGLAMWAFSKPLKKAMGVKEQGATG
ncbi:MAG: peptide MFS transporter [Deltaproteobacteria bacterium]|nr:peptide MFS transporter [Deltaproteobacteria bacterium]